MPKASGIAAMEGVRVATEKTNVDQKKREREREAELPEIWPLKIFFFLLSFKISPVKKERSGQSCQDGQTCQNLSPGYGEEKRKGKKKAPQHFGLF